MPQVAIVGAGSLGGELAFLLARQDAAESLVLLDDAGQVAAGKALDIMQSGPVEGFSTRVSGHTDLFLATGAHVIVLADRARAGEWQGEEALALLRRLVRVGSPSIVICAGAGQAPIVEIAVRELGMDRRRVFGTAPEALASGVRALAAAEADRSVREIGLSVLGNPPDRVVIPWGEATVAGFTAARTLDEPALRRLAARASHLWPPGALALASAATLAVRAVLGGSRQGLSVFMAPDDKQGMKMRTAALPVVLGPHGVERVERPTLSGHDQVALDNAMLL